MTKLNFKEKLSKFYGKNYCAAPISGGWFVIATGDFLPGYALRGYSTANAALTFNRVDGCQRLTIAGRSQVEKIKKQFTDNLNKLGIVWIDDNTPREVWTRIAYFFSNETAPCIKKAADRENWIDL